MMTELQLDQYYDSIMEIIIHITVVFVLLSMTFTIILILYTIYHQSPFFYLETIIILTLFLQLLCTMIRFFLSRIRENYELIIAVLH